MAHTPSQTSKKSDSRQQEVYPLRDTAYQRSMITRTAAGEAAFFLPHLRQGMSLLDCGCGPGSVTLDLARIVAPGQVVGVDIDAGEVKRASALAAGQGVTHVRFETGNVYALPFANETFDAVYSNALLDHLREPLNALREIRRVLKPGGVAGIRAADRDGNLFVPLVPLIAKYLEWTDRLKADQGVNSRIGKHLRALLRQAGFVRVEASASYDSYGTPERVRMLGEALASNAIKEWRAEEILKSDWTDRAELEQIAAAFRAWAEQPDAFFVQTRCEAVGWCE
jgi:ubiquinone/menaquinone biosynthesis C-methylase UbiE